MPDQFDFLSRNSSTGLNLVSVRESKFQQAMYQEQSFHDSK